MKSRLQLPWMVAALSVCLGNGGPEAAEEKTLRIVPIQSVGIDQRVGEKLSLDLAFRDEGGAPVTLREAIRGKPTVLALVYYRCPMLCTLVLNGLLQALVDMTPSAGEQFNVVAVSFDPSEEAELARAKKAHYLKAYGRASAGDGWRFLTGGSDSISRLCRETGFRISYDPVTRQYAHGSALIILTPEGAISRYLFGVSFPTRELRLSLVEASAGKIGTATDQFLLLCMRYDVATGKYGLAITRILQAAAAATVLVLGGLLVALSRRRKLAPPDPVPPPAGA
jgi:protein SCO1/2